MPQNTDTPAKSARVRHGWTLRDLADQCEAHGAPVDFGSLGRIERGEVTPRPRLRAVLAALLEIDVEEIQRTEVSA